MKRVTMAMTLVGLVAVACGGGSSSSSSTTPAAVTTGGGSVSGIDAGQCGAAAQALSAAAAAIPAAINGTSGDIQQQVDALQSFTDAAPAEIKDDLQTVTDGYAHWLQVWQDSNIQPGQIPSADVIAKLTEAAQSVTSADFNAAAGRVSAWLAANCQA